VSKDTLAVSRLLCAARKGDQQAFDELLTQYMPIIEHQLSGIRSKYSAVTIEDEKDLRQEAYLAFYRATASYDVTQHEVSFGLYAKICVENGLISALRKMKPSVLPLDMETLSAIPDWGKESDPTRRVREQEDYEALCRTIAGVLSPYENQIWQRYIAGATAARIAEQMGKDTRSVHNAIYRIRHKLRRVIEAEQV
jgi:RNA polymerase sporulation-specific sigma factor